MRCGTPDKLQASVGFEVENSAANKLLTQSGPMRRETLGTLGLGSSQYLRNEFSSVIKLTG